MQTLIENVNIITPGEDIKTHQNVLIEDNLIKTKIKDSVAKFLFSRTHRSPMILPVIMEV